MNIKNKSFMLTEGYKKYFSEFLLWWVNPDNIDGCSLSLKCNGKKTVIRLNPHKSCMLMLRYGEILITHGSVTVVPADITSVIKFIAFMDSALNIVDNHKTRNWYFFTPYYFNKINENKIFEQWLIKVNILQPERAKKIFSMLRTSERYWLVRYLLESETNVLSLKELGDKYGLSVAHFRRLSKKALGKSTKEELNNWRLAKALLSLIEDDESITNIALKHGYSSLSHFSCVVKAGYGLSPRELKKIFNSDLCL